MARAMHSLTYMTASLKAIVLLRPLHGEIRLSPTIPPIQLLPNVLFTIFYYLPPKNASPYNSFSPTIHLISIPPIYYHSLTNYLFNVFEFKKNHTIFVLS